MGDGVFSQSALLLRRLLAFPSAFHSHITQQRLSLHLQFPQAYINPIPAFYST